MVELEAELLEAAREAFDAHDRECDQCVYAVLLNPGNHTLLGWNEIFGLPVLPDDRVPPMKVWLTCCSTEDRCNPKWAGHWEGQRVWWVKEEAYLEEPPVADVRG